MNRRGPALLVTLLGSLALPTSLALSAALALAGCVAERGSTSIPADGEIVFGVAQEKIAADGGERTTTRAAWDILTLGGRGTSITGVDDPGRSCWSEDLKGRLGRPRVDRGVALFRGGRLPAEGLRIVANQVDTPSFDGAGWVPGEVLEFESEGFAAPDVPLSRLVAPSTDLAISAPPPGELALARDADLAVTWDVGDSGTAGEKVVVSLSTSDAIEVRCFFPRAAGTGVLPREFIGKLPSAARGTVSIKTHRQISGVVGRAWIVYVVASVEHRSQAFALDR